MTRHIKNQQPHFEVILQEDPETGDILIPFPDELLSIMGWKEGQIIEFDKDQNNNWILRAANNATQ